MRRQGELGLGLYYGLSEADWESSTAEFGIRRGSETGLSHRKNRDVGQEVEARNRREVIVTLTACVTLAKVPRKIKMVE